jgi:hypothetical protein
VGCQPKQSQSQPLCKLMQTTTFTDKSENDTNNILNSESVTHKRKLDNHLQTCWEECIFRQFSVTDEFRKRTLDAKHKDGTFCFLVPCLTEKDGNFKEITWQTVKAGAQIIDRLSSWLVVLNLCVSYQWPIRCYWWSWQLLYWQACL